MAVTKPQNKPTSPTDPTHHDPKKGGHSHSHPQKHITRKEFDVLTQHVQDLEKKHKELRAKDSDLQGFLNDINDDLDAGDQKQADADYQALLQAVGEGEAKPKKGKSGHSDPTPSKDKKTQPKS
jgi:hypothetical protein